MTTTNSSISQFSNRKDRALSFQFPPEDERRRDILLRAAWMQIVARFSCRPSPRGPWDEAQTGDVTPWKQPLSAMRNAMASAVFNGNPELIDATAEGVRAFCRQLEADVTSMAPVREEESLVAIALDETHAEGEANQVEALLISSPTPINADRAVQPLERQAERILRLIHGCRKLARAPRTSSLAQVTSR